MITYKIYHSEDFSDTHHQYFTDLVDDAKNKEFLSPNIDEIIITDDMVGELARYSINRNRIPNLTNTREFISVSKIAKFNGKFKIFFDANIVNPNSIYSIQAFTEQLIQVYAEDIVAQRYNLREHYTTSTPFKEVITIIFAQWATSVISNRLKIIHNIPSEYINEDVKMFVDDFKRKIRKHQYIYHADNSVDTFWANVITDLDFFIRRCLDVKFDSGNFNELQEFSEIIPPLLSEIDMETNKLLKDEPVEFSSIQSLVLQILNICFIDVSVEGGLAVQITDTPKRLFKGNIVDTEQRLVAFVDILGFSEIIKEYDTNPFSNILNELHDTLETAMKSSISNIIRLKGNPDVEEFLEYRMFSDCICLSLPYTEVGNDFHIQFHSLSSIVKTYQLQMMLKGFYVRGGISIGSFYSDRNMIFSGALVSAYKLETLAVNPIIEIDPKVIARLNKNFTANATGLFFEGSLIQATVSKSRMNWLKRQVDYIQRGKKLNAYLHSGTKKIFLNPFSLLENSLKSLEYFQSLANSITYTKNENGTDELVNTLTLTLKETLSLTDSIYENAKSKVQPEIAAEVKSIILRGINEKIATHKAALSALNRKSNEFENTTRILSKYEYLKAFTEWSIGIRECANFKIYNFLASEY